MASNTLNQILSRSKSRATLKDQHHLWKQPSCYPYLNTQIIKPVHTLGWPEGLKAHRSVPPFVLCVSLQEGFNICLALQEKQLNPKANDHHKSIVWYCLRSYYNLALFVVYISSLNLFINNFSDSNSHYNFNMR